jgi:hypothetical protein
MFIFTFYTNDPDPKEKRPNMINKINKERRRSIVNIF